MHALRFVLISVLLFCLGVSRVDAQPPEFIRVQDTISANGDSFVVAVRGFASARFQTLDSYSGTWEVQCSVDDGTTYDTDDEVNLNLEGATAAPATSVTDTVGIWTANVAACTHIKVIATAGFAASDTVVAVAAIPSGGGAAPSGTATVAGNLTNDTAAATSNRVATLPVITETSAPSRTNGRDAALSGTAGGAIRVMLTDAAGAAVSVASDATLGTTTYTEASSTAPGLFVRNDTPDSLVNTTNEVTAAGVNANGAVWTSTIDPCSSEAKTTTAISLTADTVIISATASKKNYICALVIVAGAAEIVSITEGTGSTCATSEAALVGSTTDANGMSFAANGGASIGTGVATVVAGITANVDTCLNVSGTNRVSGFVTWVQR